MKNRPKYDTNLGPKWPQHYSCMYTEVKNSYIKNLDMEDKKKKADEGSWIQKEVKVGTLSQFWF